MEMWLEIFLVKPETLQESVNDVESGDNIVVMRPLSGQVNIHLAQLNEPSLTLFYLMCLVYYYKQLSIEIQR